MTITKRSELKSRFVKNAIPTQSDFADLIDAPLNQTDDQVFRPDKGPLSVVAAPVGERPVLRLMYSNLTAADDWLISLGRQDSANPDNIRKGLGIADGGGKTRLFIDAQTGGLEVDSIFAVSKIEATSIEATSFLCADWLFSTSSQGLRDPRTPRKGLGIADSGGKLQLFIDAETGGLEVNSILCRTAIQAYGAATINGGAQLMGIGICTQNQGALKYPWETIQLKPESNLRVWFGTTERFVLRNDGTMVMYVAGGRWEFTADRLNRYDATGGLAWSTAFCVLHQSVPREG